MKKHVTNYRNFRNIVKINAMNRERLTSIFEKNHPKTPMTEDESKMTIRILMSEEPELLKDINDVDKNSEIYKHFEPIINGFQMRVFLSRLEHHAKLKISFGAFLMIAIHLDSAGTAVMYAYYLFHKKHPADKFIDITKVTLELFPWGFFSEKQLDEMWKEQKVKADDGLDECTCCGAPDNLLDYVEFWEK